MAFQILTGIAKLFSYFIVDKNYCNKHLEGILNQEQGSSNPPETPMILEGRDALSKHSHLPNRCNFYHHLWYA